MKKIVFLLCLFCTLLSYTQNNGTIGGNVIDLEVNNEPLIYADIKLQNTDISTQTNFHGNFELSNVAPGDYNLVIHYLGYETRIIPISLKKSERIEIKTGLAALKIEFGKLNLDVVSEDPPAEGRSGERKRP